MWQTSYHQQEGWKFRVRRNGGKYTPLLSSCNLWPATPPAFCSGTNPDPFPATSPEQKRLIRLR